MILQSIHDYVLKAGRTEESVLLTHFHLRKEGLDALMAPLLKSGKVQKTVHQRGKQLEAVTYYSCANNTQIPVIGIV